jgi:hypothetical protein
VTLLIPTKDQLPVALDRLVGGKPETPLRTRYIGRYCVAADNDGWFGLADQAQRSSRRAERPTGAA